MSSNKTIPLGPINTTSLKVKENQTRTLQITQTNERNFIGPQIPEGKTFRKKSAPPPVPKFEEKPNQLTKQETLNKFLSEIKEENNEKSLINEGPNEKIDKQPLKTLSVKEKCEQNFKENNNNNINTNNNNQTQFSNTQKDQKQVIENNNYPQSLLTDTKQQSSGVGDGVGVGVVQPQLEQNQQINNNTIKNQETRVEPIIKTGVQNEVPISEKIQPIVVNTAEKKPEQPVFQKPDFKLNLDLISNMYKQQINQNQKKETPKKNTENLISNEKVLIPLMKKEIKPTIEEYDPTKPNDYESLLGERMEKERKMKELEKKNRMEIEEPKYNPEVLKMKPSPKSFFSFFILFLFAFY